jgi:hypothetical protein
MASVVEEVEFLIQMYKKSSNKAKFSAILKQLFADQDFSKEAFEIMNRIAAADQGVVPATSPTVKPPTRKPAPKQVSVPGCDGAGRGGC